MKKTKIVCTLGPSSNNLSTIREMILSGMNVARLNMSHANHTNHKELINLVKQAREELNLPVGIMIDTKGPEIRVGLFEDGSIMLKEGKEFTLTTKKVLGNIKQVSVSYKNLPNLLDVSDKILLNDGLIELQVVKTSKDSVLCKVVHGGELSNNKSINLPDINLHMDYLSEQDKKDIKFGVMEDAEILALSFVNSAEDVLAVKEYIKSFSNKMPLIISKIESKLGVRNMNEIIEVSDGVMVARGDLGVEIDFEKIPYTQKTLIEKCNKKGKISITATQMLESMINSPRPTRAEITDIANAILDGSSAIMLSGETTVGKFPVLAVETMSKIAMETEAHLQHNFEHDCFCLSATQGIGLSATTLANSLNAKVIAVVTTSGKSAISVARYKPACPIVAISPNKYTMYKLSLLWNTFSVLDKQHSTINEMLSAAKQKVKKLGFANKGDTIVQTAGSPSTMGGTNLLTVSKI